MSVVKNDVRIIRQFITSEQCNFNGAQFTLLAKMVQTLSLLEEMLPEVAGIEGEGDGRKGEKEVK